jgi:hypothetical protein
MKIFVHTLITMAILTLGSVARADAKTFVITGRVVQLSEQNITVQSGKKRVEISYTDANYTKKPKVGDTVTVHYKPYETHYRFDPDYEATKIEIVAAASSKQ